MLLLIPLLPFLGFLLNASFGKRVSKAAAGAVACGAMVGLVPRCRWYAVWQLGRRCRPNRARIANQVFTWISSGDFTAGVHAAARSAVVGDDPGRSPASAR